ncbi:hypothetical protein OOZ63_13855 [Paucibacter sp. PLA-PC-4]|uniref:hypothetical protein n=1 Tax=Paucibacter sp. PLA-PC-4 TaxID=2993655 RepID=UPI002249610C|nr:hypothetical protein [Paucibacter sp. PLA-PC-4]MCX2862916.1 hypothetical protein [Paucibacter sp. PLA-PC-4]
MPCPHALQHRPELRLWQAEHPALSAALLQRPELGVRPPGKPLPAHLEGSRLGRLFGLWLRQRDDASRSTPKQALVRALKALPAAELRAQARRQAALALTGGWNHWVWATPSASIAAVLGLPLDSLSDQRWLHEQLRAIAGALQDGQAGAADPACAALLQSLATPAAAAAPLQACLHRLGPAQHWPGGVEEFEANRLALLWQSHEAGAALLGNALARLATEPALRRPGRMLDWLPTLLREGGGVRNTRRFALESLEIGGVRLRPGDALLLNLAGKTTEADDVGFGAGAHRCPGQDLALETAAAALELLLAYQDGRRWPTPTQGVTLANAYIPAFIDPQEHATP